MELKFAGVKELQKALNKLPYNMQKQAYRKGMTKGAQIANRAAKANARAIKDTGALAKSIGYTISKDRRNAKIGARRGFRQPAPAGRRGKKQQYIDPFNYAHLVELGTRARVTKTGVSRGAMKATPFLRPAVQQNQQQIYAAIAQGIREGMDAAIARAKAREARKR